MLEKIGFMTCLVMLAVGVVPATASAQDAGIWRARLRLSTCDAPDASSDATLWVAGPAGDRFYLDLPGPDFVRGQTREFDVTLSGASRMEDLSEITLGTDGTDAVCLSEISLLINAYGVPVYSDRRAVWIEGSGRRGRPSVSVDRAELTRSVHWSRAAAVSAIPAANFPREVLEAIIAGRVGHEMHGTGLYWGGLDGRAHVQIDHPADYPANEARLRLDLRRSTRVIRDPEVDVTTRLSVTCAAGRVTWAFRDTDVRSSSSGLIRLLTGGLTRILEVAIERGVTAAFESANLPSTRVGVCPSINFDGEGDLTFR